MTGDLVRKNQTQNDSDQVLDKIIKALEGLKYGEVVSKYRAKSLFSLTGMIGKGSSSVKLERIL